MWTRDSVEAGVEAARSIVRGDGADLVLLRADERRGEIALRLDVTNLHCDDGTCLLPGRLLKNLITAQLQEHLEGEFELVLEDPRESA
jgi:hypothetical protein